MMQNCYPDSGRLVDGRFSLPEMIQSLRFEINMFGNIFEWYYEQLWWN